MNIVINFMSIIILKKYYFNNKYLNINDKNVKNVLKKIFLS
jgi:hypothetical protein